MNNYPSTNFTRRVLGTAATPEAIPVGDENTIIPGREPTFIIDGFEYAVEIHALVDRDYLGQWAYLQICRREYPATTHFGPWEYGFYYRGGDSDWRTWTLDLNFGDEYPSYAAFGKYIDDHEQG